MRSLYMDIRQLLREMSLEEKLGQLTQLNSNFFKENTAEITGPAADLGLTIDECCLAGSVLNFDSAETMIAIQKIAMERQPHHIPLMFMMDVIHGHRTVYPIPLALGCSFDMDLVSRCCSMAARESAASGVMVTFSPMADLSRDARWGRVNESTGEDPYLNYEMAKAQVKGYQGSSLMDQGTMVACVKHFAAYGGGEAGLDYNNVEISEHALREFYMDGYKGAIDAGARMIMTSYNAIGGIPATSQKHLLTDILRNEWDFDGTVISDYYAIPEIASHGVAKDDKEAAMLAINAGNEIEMMSSSFLKYGKELLNENKITMDQIDKATYHVLKLKEELGLFENPFRFASTDSEKKIWLCDEHRAIAKEAAIKSSVLLKNDGVLPISKNTNKIALIGPFANEKEILGSWAIRANTEDTITIYDGIKKYCTNSQIDYVKGCDWDGSNLACDSAIKAAKASEVVILCLGEHQSLNGEGASRAKLELPQGQIELARQVISCNKNTVVVLIGGRPQAISDLVDIAPAILCMWQPGTEGGNACASLIFGESNPSGRLAMSFPYSSGQEPIYYSHLPTARPPKSRKTIDYEYNVSRYIDVPTDPQFVFGYGLSYTSYEYTNLRVDKRHFTEDETIKVCVDVTNTGHMDGEETVMLFIHDMVAEISRPVKLLKDFCKVNLKQGETKTVEFILDKNKLSYVHKNLNRYADKGEFEIFVGHDSDTNNKVLIELV